MDKRIDSQKLSEILNARGIANLSTLAKHSGVHRNTIRAYLKGEKSPYTSSFMSIVGYLGIDPQEIISDNNDENGPLKELLCLISPVVSSNPDLAFILIGSRAKGEARKYSDIDLGVTASPGSLDYKRYLSLRSEIEDLVDDFSWLVDVVNLDAAPLWFLQGMNYEIKFFAGNTSSFAFFRGVIDGIKKAGTKETIKEKRGKSRQGKKAARGRP